jgi:orotidine-5'-phosphate decarboxylase
MNSRTSGTPNPAVARAAAEPILALDVRDAREALALADRLPRANFVKVGLQLYTAEGPPVLRELRARGRRIFLDLKLHDIPNTVARAVESASALGVELLTIHASGGDAMLRAATAAAGGTSASLRLLAVTVLTSLDGEQLAAAWGRPAVRLEDEVLRLAALARDAGLAGVVASVQETASLRGAFGRDFRILTPGIRLPGDAAGDQARIATPAEAARLGADYLVIGRTVTAASDPAAAYERVLEDLLRAPIGAGAR